MTVCIAASIIAVARHRRLGSLLIHVVVVIVTTLAGLGDGSHFRRRLLYRFNVPVGLLLLILIRQRLHLRRAGAFREMWLLVGTRVVVGVVCESLPIGRVVSVLSMAVLMIAIVTIHKLSTRRAGGLDLLCRFLFLSILVIAGYRF